jgi:hypothetical protein
MNWESGILLVLRLGVGIFEAIREGMAPAVVIKRARLILDDVEKIDADVDEVARPRTAEARRREEIEIE